MASEGINAFLVVMIYPLLHKYGKKSNINIHIIQNNYFLVVALISIKYQGQNTRVFLIFTITKGQFFPYTYTRITVYERNDESRACA